ncbi:MAG: DUF3662 and FHA domain-containing protein [Armatimonadota bacterium]|nr:DUF3662 and FHA domain-containing protein [Armatimonadota bacterium]MDR5696657.1 DUF3662 and FHA domain-containing protein [Armatimonadota bacterium]
MSLFARWEKRLESLVEGLFARTFKGPLHPVEIARQLARAMEEGQTPSVSRTYAPNAFTVVLSPRDHAGLAGFQDALVSELVAYLREHAESRGFTLVGPLQVHIHSSEAVESGRVQVQSRTVAGPSAQTEGPAEVADTRVYRIGGAGRRAVLTVAEGEPRGAVVPVAARPILIGRRQGCDVVVPDPNVSREHLRVERTPEGALVVDLDSTNGTFVNGQRVHRRLLRPGDRIRIGTTVLEYREEE